MVIVYIGVVLITLIVAGGCLSAFGRHRAMEASLRDRVGALEREVVARQKGEQDAIDATLAKGEFVATISHEIRTPLNGVLGMTQLLLDTRMSAEQREYAEAIRSSGEALLTILNDVLDFSKIEAGKMQLERLPFDVERTAGEVAELLGPNAHAKGLEIVLDVDAPQELTGDSGRVRQVLLNLAGNAIKFTDRGHVLIRVFTYEDAGQSYVEFAVHDTGIGLSPQASDRLFAKFTQAEASTSRRFGGTGLGLAISKRLVELMGGSIGVESKEDVGSKFWFRMPVDEQSAVLAQVPDTLADTRVLVVGAKEVARRTLVAQLERWSMKVESVSSGSEALLSLRGAPDVDLVIIDHHVPAIDAEALALVITGDPALEAVSIVVTNAARSLGDSRRFEDVGCHGYLVKPVRPDLLRKTLVGIQTAPRRSVEPALTPAFEAPFRGFASSHPPAMRLRVLLAEDNIVNQKIAIKMLERIGCSVAVAANGIEAVQMSDEAAYDVIFMDCQMPEMDGFGATRAIRAREAGTDEHVPIIAMTANVSDADRKECASAGMDGHFAKPFQKSDLSDLVDDLVEQVTLRAA